MSTIFLSKFLLLLVLLLNPRVLGARPLSEHNGPKYINLKAEKGNGKRVFKGGSVEACLPKGFRRSSAPSRYINYQPLGTTSCINLRNSSNKKHQKLARVMKKEDNNNSFSKTKNICVPFKSFGRSCSRLTREHRARFYILRRCVTMLICWQDCE
ncbi:hypothetical protein V8G54_027788 [Vigna mungo]|uniref:Uncharacterized protein n=1 Tax=Vigna mungo TaxID=3915 RepID=A0AAQ3RK01_VIGMU